MDDNSKEKLDELIELEFDEDSIAYYIEDEDGNEIGVCLYEDGKEVEYLYEPEAAPKHLADIDDEFEIDDEDTGFEGILGDKVAKSDLKLSPELKENIEKTKEEFADVKDDSIEIAKELKKAAGELNDAYSEIIDTFKIF